ncbi:hypothetical protein G114_15766 [Aeromonas diversa CDC 2478-85]|uniref:Transmembrane cytochrome oxidase associated protein n=1 Tax=Aeromonas diversa CDC 2478-85 TaxID=1268237 RepID=N9VH21_9GAMM|nr:hypothetical protein [Aeromonas diversa]ENY70938.1 hypothetical protein G114_15766 [Aeromonas diversa CDC 2478-85]
MLKQKAPLALLLTLLLPLLLAKLVLVMGWYHAGTRNQGTWLPQSAPLLASDPSGWRLLYLYPAACQAQCDEVPHLQERIRVALGRQADMLTLQRRPLGTQPPLPEGPLGLLVLVDGAGLGVLGYPLPEEQARWPRLGKAVLQDVQQLLRYGRAAQ